MKIWWQLTRLQWRSSWKLLLLPPTVLAVLVIGSAAGVKGLYPNPADRLTYAQTLGASLSSITVNGRGYGLESLGGITAYEVGFFGQLMFSFLGVIMAVRLTRRVEDGGVLELVTALRVHRLAWPSVAALSMLVSWSVFGVLTTTGMVAAGYPGLATLRYVLSMTAFGLAWSGVGLAVAQFATTACTALGLGLGLVFLGYLTRAVVDSQSSSWTWLSPMSWVVEARAWDHWSRRPVLALLGLALTATATALLICAHRDLGSGLLATRLGPAQAGRSLSRPWGLAWRLGRGPSLGWLLGSCCWTATLGVMTQDFAEAVAKNPIIAAALGGSVANLAAEIALLVAGCCAGSAGLAVILRLGTEESQARLGLLLAGRRSRWQWWGSWCLVAAGTAAVVMLVDATAFGLAQWWALGTDTAMADVLTAGVRYLPAIWAMVAVGAILTSALPRLRGLAWMVPAWAITVGLLAPTLRLPQWSRQLSLMYLVGRLPTTEPNWTALWGLCLAAVVAIVWGGLVFHRDLVRG